MCTTVKVNKYFIMRFFVVIVYVSFCICNRSFSPVLFDCNHFLITPFPFLSSGGVSLWSAHVPGSELSLFTKTVSSFANWVEPKTAFHKFEAFFVASCQYIILFYSHFSTSAYDVFSRTFSFVKGGLSVF